MTYFAIYLLSEIDPPNKTDFSYKTDPSVNSRFTCLF